MHDVINNIKTLFKKGDRNKLFHSKVKNLLGEISTEKILLDTIEKNLLDNNFLNQKWISSSIPKFNFYQDENISIFFNLFFPIENQNNIAMYLPHHHGNFELTSMIIYGNGYHTMTFDVIDEISKSNSLTLSDDFHHHFKKSYFLDSMRPHVIFNPSNFTVSVAVWTKSSSINEFNFENRINYSIEENKIIEIKESEFISKVQLDKLYTENSEKHIQGLCYFISKIGYNNKRVFESILLNKKSNKYWYKWINKLKNLEKIKMPLWYKNLNTLGVNISKNQMRSVCKRSFFL